MDLKQFREYLIDDKYLNESLLTEKEFNITVLPPEVLITKLSNGKLSVVETVAAFIKKHLIVNNCIDIPPLLEREFSAALAMAGFLDCYFKSTGKALGPLHGLPISDKQLETIKVECFGSDGDLGALGNIPLNIVFHPTLMPPNHVIHRSKNHNPLFRNSAIH